MHINVPELHAKQQKLLFAQTELKKAFVGIDQIIDELIHQIRIWYLMPDLLTKPVIVNLWGMTGVGKTDLVRRLVQLLDFEDAFAEIELSHSLNSAYFRYSHSLTEVLQRFSIRPDAPSILFFDEIQKFRTIDEDKKDISNLQFQDFWELLSDGKLSKRDQGTDLEEMFLELMKQTERDEIDRKDHPNDPIKQSKISGWDARKLKNMLNLSHDLSSLKDLGNHTNEEAMNLLAEQFNTKQIYQTNNYRLALIIISGNLDEAYEMAKQTQEAEIDPDIFHAQTSKISLIEIKQSLTTRFKPEQISRFGNIHLIYPSLRGADFVKLIDQKTAEICERIEKMYAITVKLDQSIKQLIFNNGVFPVQGVRPVFSAISDIVESNLSKILFTCLTEGFSSISVTYDISEKMLVAELQKNQGHDQTAKTVRLPFVGRIDRVRQSHSEDMIALTSVHEAGHSVVYAVLFGLSPLQLKSNLASTATAGFTFPHLLEITKKSSLQKIQVLLGGILAEKIIFGNDHVSAGSSSDLEAATSVAADYIRKYGFADLPVKIMSENVSGAEEFNTDLAATNQQLQKIISEQQQKSEQILIDHRAFLVEVSQQLAANMQILPTDFVKIAAKYGISCDVKNEEYRLTLNYAQILAK